LPLDDVQAPKLGQKQLSGLALDSCVGVKFLGWLQGEVSRERWEAGLGPWGTGAFGGQRGSEP